MKKPAPTEVKTSDLDIAIIGTFPKRRNTVRAEVLADWLSGEYLTGMDAVVGSSTTRLASVAHALKSIYGWAFQTSEIHVSTRDGRVAEICTYFLNAAIRKAAIEAGASQFIADVRAQRKARRKQCHKARREAERRNIARALVKIDPRQVSLI